MQSPSEGKNNPSYTYVQSAQGLTALIQKLRAAVRVGIDTEADGLHRYSAQVCLIQLSFTGENFIVDPLAGFSLTEFLEVLSEKELIFQGADYDLRVLKKSFGFRPKAPVFDTMLAAQVLGYEKIGLAALAERFLGVAMSKSGQKADWSKRPLPEWLLAYASDDTKYLEQIADAMTEQLQKLNRMDWHRECCERVVIASGFPDKSEEKEAWRIKGSSRMTPRELVFVRELWKWRDELARKEDRPAFFIFKNEDIIELALWRLKNPQAELQAGPSFLKRITGENLVRLKAAIAAAENTPQNEWPLPAPRMAWEPVDVKVEQLMAACKTLAQELQIEPSFLASRGTLMAAIRQKPRSVEQVMEASGMMRWQAELMTPAIEAIP